MLVRNAPAACRRCWRGITAHFRTSSPITARRSATLPKAFVSCLIRRFTPIFYEDGRRVPYTLGRYDTPPLPGVPDLKEWHVRDSTLTLQGDLREGLSSVTNLQQVVHAQLFEQLASQGGRTKRPAPAAQLLGLLRRG